MQVDHQSPEAYINAQQASAPEELKSWWEKLSKAYDRKLWHNITILLHDFVNRPAAAPYLVELFESFVQPIEKKLNPLKLVQIARIVAVHYQDPSKSLAFLQSLKDRLPSPHVPDYATSTSSSYDPSQSYTPPPPPAAEAFALSLSSIAYAQLMMNDVETAKASLDECEGVLDGIGGVESGVMGAFYAVSADYWKVKAAYVPFYKSSLLFLACIDVDAELSSEEKVVRARDLSIAALLGDKIYNFGELLQHPILKSLDGSDYQWIKDMLFVFNAGDLGKYDVLVEKLDQEPILAAERPFLRQKICLMALIEAVFRRPRSQRAMSFQTIAEETRLDVGEVEHLVMKALSLDLIRGSIDQVNSLTNIHWVQPRVLDADQTRALYERLSEWSDKVGLVGETVGGWRQPLGVVA